MANLRIEKLLSTDPVEPLKPNTLYLVKSATGELVNAYVTNTAGDAILRFADEQYIRRNYITVSDTPPDLPCETQLWWDSATGNMFIQYDDGNSVSWVEAIPGQVLPEFGGNGVANTMSRSDHFHYGVELTSAEW